MKPRELEPIKRYYKNTHRQTDNTGYKLYCMNVGVVTGKGWQIYLNSVKLELRTWSKLKFEMCTLCVHILTHSMNQHSSGIPEYFVK
jgi:hypothetical protein